MLQPTSEPLSIEFFQYASECSPAITVKCRKTTHMSKITGWKSPHDPLFTSDAYNKATANNVHWRRLAYDLFHTLRVALFRGLTYTTPIGGSQER